MAQPASARNKYASVNLNSSYGKSSILSTSVRSSSKVGPYGNMLVLGKARGQTSVGPKSSKLALPKPVNLPSLKKEHAGNDPTITLVSGGGSGAGWIKQEKPEEDADVLLQEAGVKSALSTGSTWGTLNPQGEASLAAPAATVHVPPHVAPYVPPARSGVYTPPAARGSAPAPQQYRTAPSERQPVLKKEDFPTLQAAVVPASVPPQKLKDQQQKQKEQQQQLRDQQQKLQELSEQQHARQQERGPRNGGNEPVLSTDVHQHQKQQPNSQSFLSTERSGQPQDTWRKPVSDDDAYRRPIVPKIESIRNWADDEREGPSQSLRPQSGHQGDFFDRGQERGGAQGFHRGGQHDGGFGRGGFYWNGGGQGDRGFSDEFRLPRDRDNGLGRRGFGADEGGRFRQSDRFGRSGGDGNLMMQEGFRSHGGRSDFNMPFPPRNDYDRRQQPGFGRFPVPDPFLRDFGDVEFPRLHSSEFRKDAELRRQVPATAQEDFKDPIREAFDAELERVQRLQEEERQRKVEEKRAEEERKKREIEELERQAREEVERVAREEQEAQEARERARREAEEVARRLEEERRQIQDEKKRLAEEEERRKENARRKLQELEERMARREMERKAQEAAAAAREEKWKEEEDRFPAKHESGARMTMKDDTTFREEHKPPNATSERSVGEGGFSFARSERSRDNREPHNGGEPTQRSQKSIEGDQDAWGAGGGSGEHLASRLQVESWRSSHQSSEAVKSFQPGGFGADSGVGSANSVQHPPPAAPRGSGSGSGSSDFQAAVARDRVLKGSGVDTGAWGSGGGHRVTGPLESAPLNNNDGLDRTAQPLKERWRNVVEAPQSTSKHGQPHLRSNGLAGSGSKELAPTEAVGGIAEIDKQSMVEDSAKKQSQATRQDGAVLADSKPKDQIASWPAARPSVLVSGQGSTSGKQSDVRPVGAESQESGASGESSGDEAVQLSNSEVEGGHNVVADLTRGQPSVSLGSELEEDQDVAQGPKTQAFLSRSDQAVNAASTTGTATAIVKPAVSTSSEGSPLHERSVQSPSNVKSLPEVQQIALSSEQHQQVHPQLPSPFSTSQMGPWHPVAPLQQQQQRQAEDPSAAMQMQAILAHGIRGVAHFGDSVLQRPSLLGSLPLPHQILQHHQQHQQQHVQQQQQQQQQQQVVLQSGGEQTEQELHRQSSPQFNSHGLTAGCAEALPPQAIQFGSLPVHLPQPGGSLSAPHSHPLLPPPTLPLQPHPMQLPFLPFAPHFGAPPFAVGQPFMVPVTSATQEQSVHVHVQSQGVRHHEEKQNLPAQLPEPDVMMGQNVAESILSPWKNHVLVQSESVPKREEVVDDKPVVSSGAVAVPAKVSGRGRKSDGNQRGSSSGREVINGAAGGPPRVKSAWNETEAREKPVAALDRGSTTAGSGVEDSRRDSTSRNCSSYGVRDSLARQVAGGRGSAAVAAGSRGQGLAPGRGGQGRGAGRGQGNRNRQIVDGFGGASGSAITSEIASDGVVLRTRVRVRGIGGRRGLDVRGRGNSGNPNIVRSGKVARLSESDGDRLGGAHLSPRTDMPILSAAGKVEGLKPELSGSGIMLESLTSESSKEGANSASVAVGCEAGELEEGGAGLDGGGSVGLRHAEAALDGDTVVQSVADVAVAEVMSGSDESHKERTEKQSSKLELDETKLKASSSQVEHSGRNAGRQEKKSDNLRTKKPASRTLEPARALQHVYNEEPLDSGVVRVYEQYGIKVSGDDDDFIEVRSKRQLLNDKREQREKAKKESKGLGKKQERGSGRKNEVVHAAKSGDASSPSSGQVPGWEKRQTSSPGSSTGSRLGASGDASSSPANHVPEDRRVSTARKEKGPRAAVQPRSAGNVGQDTLGNQNSSLSGLAKPQLSDVLAAPKVAWGDRNSTLQVVSLSQGKQSGDAIKVHKFDIPVPSPGHPRFSTPMAAAVHGMAGQPGQQPLSAPDASSVSIGGAAHPFQFGNIQFGTTDLRSGGLGISHIGTSVEGMSHQPHMHRQENELTFGKLGGQTRPEDEAVSADAEAEAEAAASAVAAAAISGDEPVSSSRHQHDRDDDVSISLPDDVNTYPETAASSTGSAAGVSSVGIDDSMAAALPADLSLEPAPVPHRGSHRPPHSSGLPLQGPHPAFLEMGPMGPIFQLPPFSSDSSSQGSHNHGGGVDPSQPGTAAGGGGGWSQQQQPPPQQQQPVLSVGLDSFFGTAAPPSGFAGPPFMSHPGAAAAHAHHHHHHHHQGMGGMQGPPLVMYPGPFGPQFAQPGLSYFNFLQSGKQPDWKHTPSPNSQAAAANSQQQQQHSGTPVLNPASPGSDSNSAMAGSNSGQPQRGTAGGHAVSHRMGAAVSTTSRPGAVFDPNSSATYQSGDSTMPAHWSHIPQGLPSHSAALAYAPFMHARPHGQAHAHHPQHVHSHAPPHASLPAHGASALQSGGGPFAQGATSRDSVGLLNVMGMNNNNSKSQQAHIQANDAAAQFPEELGLGDLSSGPSVPYGGASLSGSRPSNRGSHSGAEGSHNGPQVSGSGSNGQKQQGRRNFQRSRGSSGGNNTPHGGPIPQQFPQQQAQFQQQRHYHQAGRQPDANGAEGNARPGGMQQQHHMGRRGTGGGGGRPGHGGGQHHHGLEQGMRQATTGPVVDRNALGHGLVDKASAAAGATSKVKQVYVAKPSAGSRGNYAQQHFAQGRSSGLEKDPHRGQLQGDALAPMR